MMKESTMQPFEKGDVFLGLTLLNNPDDGLDLFLDSVTDIKLFFETYSYAGR